MKKSLLSIPACLFLFTVLFNTVASAQIKGDPVFGGVAAQQDLQKTSSILSPDLKRQ